MVINYIVVNHSQICASIFIKYRGIGSCREDHLAEQYYCRLQYS